MNIKTIFAVALLALGASVAAQEVIISQAYEVALSNFRPPATQNGSASFKACDECDRMLVRVTPGTRYAINGQTVKLEDFRKAVSLANDREEKTVIVLHHLESDTIESIDVSL
jgi:hypothetical protein